MTRKPAETPERPSDSGGGADDGEAASRVSPGERARLRTLVVTALGVVYGDIGTSPLYALRECFHGRHSVTPTADNVLGVLSLIFWALLLVISLKYLLVVMRADNDGEGGILALMALVARPDRGKARIGLLSLLGLFGAALLYGDGVITPAISVLSAIEGLEVVTVKLTAWVVPITIAILIGLFLLQRRGTARVGGLFGPLTALWFVVLALMGVVSLVKTPSVLLALDPLHGVRFLLGGATGPHAGTPFVVLGTVFLVVTGGEALYADMGHFGARPIRTAWFSIVLPALLINYLGQGALLLRQPDLAPQLFYHMVPSWGRIPLVALAAVATVIASQAVITGAFSLTWQAQQLGFLPRFEIRHTSPTEIGQIYVPRINQLLLVATVAIVLGFRSSSKLASAYGVAVTSTMVITSVLLALAMRRVWRWPFAAIVPLTVGFLVVDCAFFGANILKVKDGGWFPLAVGVAVSVTMTTWRSGRRILGDRMRERSITLDQVFAQLEDVRRVPGTAVLLTGSPTGVPPALARMLSSFGAIHEQVVLLTIHTSDEAYGQLGGAEEVVVADIGQGFWRIEATFGFMERPNVPRLLARCAEQGMPLGVDLTYVLGRETLLATDRPGMALWRERLFAFMSRNAGRATEFFQIPPGQVLEIGAQIEL